MRDIETRVHRGATLLDQAMEILTDAQSDLLRQLFDSTICLDDVELLVALTHLRATFINIDVRRSIKTAKQAVAG